MGVLDASRPPRRAPPQPTLVLAPGVSASTWARRLIEAQLAQELQQERARVLQERQRAQELPEEEEPPAEERRRLKSLPADKDPDDERPVAFQKKKILQDSGDERAVAFLKKNHPGRRSGTSAGGSQEESRQGRRRGTAAGSSQEKTRQGNSGSQGQPAPPSTWAWQNPLWLSSQGSQRPIKSAAGLLPAMRMRHSAERRCLLPRSLGASEDGGAWPPSRVRQGTGKVARSRGHPRRRTPQRTARAPPPSKRQLGRSTANRYIEHI